jgi:hypothetical protein
MVSLRSARPKGKKRRGAEGKRYPLNMRTTKETRERLEAAALASGRSLAQEVEYRLEQSIDQIEAFGGAVPYKLMGALAGFASVISDVRGKEWLRHRAVFDEVLGQWYAALGKLRPRTQITPESLLLSLWVEPQWNVLDSIKDDASTEGAVKVLELFIQQLRGKTLKATLEETFGPSTNPKLS